MSTSHAFPLTIKAIKNKTFNFQKNYNGSYINFVIILHIFLQTTNRKKKKKKKKVLLDTQTEINLYL